MDDGFERVNPCTFNGLRSEEIVFDVFNIRIAEVIRDGVNDRGLIFEDELALGHGWEIPLEDPEVMAEPTRHIHDQRGVVIDRYAVKYLGLNRECL